MKRLFALITAMLMLCLSVIPVFAENAIKSGAEPEDDYTVETETDLTPDVPSAILIEAVTGEVLFEKNADEARAPASVTKTMTLLLVAEALQDGRISEDDEVTVSAYAASMGGSQVFLKEGERLTVKDLIKCTVIASANDAAVALAEHTEGSESTFVERMNQRARELGLLGSSFENVTGLDDDTSNHTMSARDIAKISRELLKHESITRYSSVWQDSIRDGAFTLTNTNRLVRYYDGCTGLKTGSTDKAGFCVSASAKRGRAELVAVIMGAASGTERNEAARALLEYGFASYSLYELERAEVGSIRIKGSEKTAVKLVRDPFCALVAKRDLGSIKVHSELPEYIKAPVNKGDTVGRAIFTVGGEKLGEAPIKCAEGAERISFTRLFVKILTTAYTPSEKRKEKL